MRRFSGRPAASPNGISDFSHAETFMNIGEAMGQAMVRLKKD